MMKIKSAHRTATLLLAMTITVFQPFLPSQVSAAADTQPPTVPQALTVVHVTPTSVSLSWTPSSDDTGVKGYQVYRDGKKMLSTAKTSYTNGDLVPGKKYTYMVRAYDANGNLSGNSNPVVAAAANDTTPPSAPGVLSLLSLTPTTAELVWEPSTDNTGIKGYDIYCNGKKAGSTSSCFYTCKGLLPDTAYTVLVKARDAAGNYSGQSNVLSISTAEDCTGPSIPDGIKASSVTATQINLSWSPASDNVKIKGYEIFRNGEKAGETAKTYFCDKNLAPGRYYSYSLRAIDSSRNVSGKSAPIQFQTQSDREAPAAPTGLKVNSVRGSSASLTWNTCTDNSGIKEYQIYCNGFQIAATTRTSLTVKDPFGMGFCVYYIKACDLAGNVSGSSNKVPVFNLK